MTKRDIVRLDPKVADLRRFANGGYWLRAPMVVGVHS